MIDESYSCHLITQEIDNLYQEDIANSSTTLDHHTGKHRSMTHQ